MPSTNRRISGLDDGSAFVSRAACGIGPTGNAPVVPASRPDTSSAEGRAARPRGTDPALGPCRGSTDPDGAARGPDRTVGDAAAVSPARPVAVAMSRPEHSAGEGSAGRRSSMTGVSGATTKDSGAGSAVFEACVIVPDSRSKRRSIALRRFFSRCQRSATCWIWGAASAAA